MIAMAGCFNFGRGGGTRTRRSMLKNAIATIFILYVSKIVSILHRFSIKHRHFILGFLLVERGEF